MANTAAREAVKKQRLKFGRWLDEKLAEGPVNQSELSRRTGIAREHLRRIRLGETGTKPETVIAIADGLGVPRKEALVAAEFEQAKEEEAMEEDIPKVIAYYNDLPDVIKATLDEMIKAAWRQHVRDKRGPTSEE